MHTSGSQTISVTDTGNAALTDTETWSVSVSTIHHYTVTSDNYTQTAGVSFTVTVTAYDLFGNVVNTDSSTSVTMTSSSGTLLFDGNGNGTFGELGDNVMVLSSGTFTITARDTVAHTGVTITATDGGAKTGTSTAYTISRHRHRPLHRHVGLIQPDRRQPIHRHRHCPRLLRQRGHTDNSTSVTMTSSSGTLLFDGNGNGTFGEAE